jgi:hypothetical protein
VNPSTTKYRLRIDGRQKDKIGGAVRILAGCLIVVAASFGLAPSSPELHNRYGPTDWERFTVRPGITATVQYGADHLACQIQIEAYQPLIHPGAQVATFIPAKDISEIVEELAPLTKRGKEVNIGGGFQSGCAAERVDEYENVSILTGMNACSPPNAPQDSAAEIIFKREICPKVKNAFAVSEPKSK